MRLRDSTGTRSAKWFGPPEDILEILGDARLVRVRGQVEANLPYRGDIKLFGVEASAEPDDLTPFLTPLPEDQKAHKARFGFIDRAKQIVLESVNVEATGGAARFVETAQAMSAHHTPSPDRAARFFSHGAWRDDFTGADNGIVKIRARRRVGGAPILTEALVLLKANV